MASEQQTQSPSAGAPLEDRITKPDSTATGMQLFRYSPTLSCFAQPGRYILYALSNSS